MRLLYVANAGSPLVQNLARELKRIRPGLVIDIISDAEPGSINERNAFDRVVVPPGGSILRRTKGVKFFWFVWKHRWSLRQVRGDYDAVHVFYLSAIWGLWAKSLRRKAPRLIVTLFGSDVYRSYWPMTWMQRRLLDSADHFTASNPHTVQRARKVYVRELRPYSELLFGLRTLDIMRSLPANSRMDAKGWAGAGENSIVVACGYNGSPNQNHGAIVNAVRSLPADLRRRLYLLLPMTSGGSASYVASVGSELKGLDVAYRIFVSRLDDMEMARIRLATDILVQVQNSDQLSGSMLEHLFAGNVLLTGGWLPYGMMAVQGLRYWTVPSLEGLDDGLRACIDLLEERKAMCEANHRIVWEMTAWSNTAPRWAALYG